MYSDWAGYRRATGLPALGPAETRKLKQLSLISIASRTPGRPLAYDDVVAELELDSARALEDLVLSARDAGLVEARLSPRSGEIHVTRCAGRDVDVASVVDMRDKLRAWLSELKEVSEGAASAVAAAGGPSRTAVSGLDAVAAACVATVGPHPVPERLLPAHGRATNVAVSAGSLDAASAMVDEDPSG